MVSYGRTWGLSEPVMQMHDTSWVTVVPHMIVSADSKPIPCCTTNFMVMGIDRRVLWLTLWRLLRGQRGWGLIIVADLAAWSFSVIATRGMSVECVASKRLLRILEVVLHKKVKKLFVYIMFKHFIKKGELWYQFASCLSEESSVGFFRLDITLAVL